MSDTLSLICPDLLEGQEFLISAEPKDIKRKLDADDSADLSEDIIHATKCLHELNRCPQSLSEQEANLKSFERKYSLLSLSLRNYSLGQLQESEQLDALMHELTLEMSYGFKRYLLQLDGNTNWVFGIQKKVAYAVNASIYYLSLLKNERYNSNKAIPSYLWQELHQLYLYAENKKLLKIKLKVAVTGLLSAADTISANYVRACLLSAIIPYDLSRKESWNLFQYLQQAAGSIIISDDLDLAQDKHCFAIDLKGGSRPVLIRSVINGNNLEPRFMITNGFTDLLKSQLSDYVNQGVLADKAFLSIDEPQLAEKLMQLMYRYSVQFIARESDRYPIEVDADTVWGLKAILDFWQYQELSPMDENFAASFEENLLDLLDESYSMPIRWQTVNESQGGLCIQEQKHGALTISESMPVLIAKHTHVRNSNWVFALTRWHQMEGIKNRVGVKFIKGKLQIACINQKPDVKLLVIGPDSSGRQFLLVPRGYLVNKNNMVLQLAGKKMLAQCVRTFHCTDADLVQIELTGNFA